MNELLFLIVGIGALLVVGLGRLAHSLLLRSISGALGFLAIAALLHWGVSLIRHEARWTELADGVLLLALAFVVARSALVLLFEVLLHRHVGLQVPRLARDVIALIVYFVIAFAILHSILGLELSALVATSAVVTVVIGLALQETLGTLLAGLTLTSERRLGARTWVEVDGTMGEVEELGWRSLVLRTLTGERLLLPNASTARSKIKVLGDGHDPIATRILLSVGYDAPPPAVSELLRRVASALPEVLAEPEPTVCVWELADNGVTYDCRLWTLHPWREFELRDAFLSRAYAALRREGYELPFPQRTVHLARRRPPGSGNERVAEALAASPLFAGLPADGLEALADASRLQTYFPKEGIVRQGEASRALYCVALGRAAVDVDGREVATLGLGEVFGEIAFLSGAPRTATVRAEGILEVVEVDGHGLRALLGRHPELAEELASRMAARQEELAVRAELTRATTEPTTLVGFLRERLLRMLTA
jgi:small-conductance mechanosensitive channel/CRP-like cAMP-binding protein